MNLLLMPLVCAALNRVPFDAKSVYERTQAGVVTVRTDVKVGSGFVIGDGTLIVTCHHVIKESPTTIKVKGQPAELLSQDPSSDIAILRVKGRVGKPLPIATALPKPGTKIYVIGNPLGLLEKTISEGIVSAVRRSKSLSLVQITAPISEGSSGGPVVDEKGNVVAMVALTLTTGQALNFAVGTPRINNSVKLASAVAKKRPFRVPKAASPSAAALIQKDIRAVIADEMEPQELVRHGPSAIPALIEALNLVDDENDSYYSDVIYALIEFGESARKPLLHVLANGKPRQREAAAALFRHVAEFTSPASTRFADSGSQEYLETRRDVQFKMALGDEVKQALIKSFQHYDSDLGSQQSALALGYLGYKDQKEALLEATKKKDSRLVALVFEALLVLLDPSEVAVAKKAFDNVFAGSTKADIGENEGNTRVEKMAGSLKVTRTEVGSALMIQLLEHEDWEVRYEICLALAERMEVEALPAVKKLLEDDDESVRWAALAAVGNLGRGEMVEKMAAYANSSNSTDRQWGVYAASLTQSAAGLEVVLSRVSDTDAIVRQKVAYALESFSAEVGGEKVKAALKKLAIDPDADVRAAAKEVLERLTAE